MKQLIRASLLRFEIEQFAGDAGLTVDKIDLFTNPLTNGHIKLEPVLHITPRSWVDALERLSQRLPSVLAKRFLVHTAARFKLPPAAALQRSD